MDEVRGHADGIEHAVTVAVDRHAVDELREGEAGRDGGPLVDHHGPGDWRLTERARQRRPAAFRADEQDRLQPGGQPARQVGSRSRTRRRGPRWRDRGRATARTARRSARRAPPRSPPGQRHRFPRRRAGSCCRRPWLRSNRPRSAPPAQKPSRTGFAHGRPRSRRRRRAVGAARETLPILPGAGALGNLPPFPAVALEPRLVSSLPATMPQPG